jgi:hypothetical protein
MTKLEASKLIAMLVAVFRPNRWDDLAQQVYESAIEDLDFDLAKRAVSRLVTVARFMPVPSEIREAAADLRHGPVRPGGDAWGEVLEQTRRVGYCGTPTFEDTIVAHIVKLWGWREICLAEGPADRARFIELYDRLARERRVDEVSGVPLPRRLSGASETAKALTHGAEPERAARANVGALVRQIGGKL